MKEISQNQIVEQYIKVIKERRKYSNCQFMVNQLEEKVQSGTIAAYELQDAFLLIENKRELYYLYYISDSWEWLNFLHVIKDRYQQLVISIVERQIAEIEAIFAEKDYFVYKTYQRLRGKGNDIDLSEVDYCNVKDKHTLRLMMDNTFDAFSDHIPTDEELEEFLEQKQIICVRRNEKVTGFIIFEDKGRTSYIRMVCVDKGYQGKGLANELMRMYFKIHEGYTGFTLWYDVRNSRTHSLYAKWNYEDEQLYHLIYVR